MDPIRNPRLALMALSAMLLGAATQAAALDLATKPLFTVSSVPPNVLVAIDNSGTMDLEVLFPTDNGLLYWDSDRWDGLAGDVLVPLVDQTGAALGAVLGQDPGNTQEGAADPGFATTDTDGNLHYYTTAAAVEGSGGTTGAPAERLLVPYGYLFPNGCNNGSPLGKRAFCALALDNQGALSDVTGLLGLPLAINNPDVQVLPLLLGEDQVFTVNAVPPIPQLGFARSPDFNRAYFDPRIDYEPWPGYGNAPPTAAPSDPVAGNQTFDLTTWVKRDDAFWRFRADVGMTLPAGTQISFGPLLDGSSALVDVLNITAEILGAALGPVVKLVCGITDFVGLGCPGVVNAVIGVLGGWHTLTADWVLGAPPTRELLALENCHTGLLGLVSCNQAVTNLLNQLLYPLDLGIRYWPATFFLSPGPDGSCAGLLPAGYPLLAAFAGTGPAGEPLCGYRIDPGTAASPTDALQNFANWFTYYRKRHLAVRGGLAAAVEEAPGRLNMGVVASNAVAIATGPQPGPAVAVRDVAPADPLGSDPAMIPNPGIYMDIYALDFSSPRPTPNRGTLAYLGEQFERSTDPVITQACQVNVAMLATDGYNTGTVTAYADADGDGATNTMADVAMSYYDALLAPPGVVDDQVPVDAGCKSSGTNDPWLDCNNDPHMVSFGVTLGQSGVIFDNPAQDAATRNPFDGDPPWDNPEFMPNQMGQAQIDDLWHATVNSRGAMLAAQRPATIDEAFRAVLAEAITLGGSGTSLAAETDDLQASNAYIYQAGFVAGAWSGDLVARRIAGDGRLAATPVWSAASLLAQRDPASRLILTTARENCGNEKTGPVPFLYHKLRQCITPLTEAGVAYIRGDRSNEEANGGTFRTRRNGVLGDIVHSNPLYVGAPNRIRYPSTWEDALNSPDQIGTAETSNAYEAFAQAQSGRTPVVYVGANDGMLHAFDADTGAELLAYIPYAVLDTLHMLTEEAYTHQYYVDGAPVTGDVAYGGAWHTVLVGSLRGGGKSVFALDVTDPAQFTQANAGTIVLWEFNAADHPGLGYTYGKPVIVRLHNGDWAAVFGNGYNSVTGTAQLFVVEIETGALIRRIDTGVGTDNGLGPVFPVDLDGDFITDYIYAGDLGGKLWKFDVTGESPSSWSARQLVQATDSNGNPRPITSQPQVGRHPYGLDYGVMVYFGTGKYIEISDPGLMQSNAFYGVWDPNVFTARENGASGTSVFAPTGTVIPDDATGDLVSQTVTLEQAENGYIYRVVSDNEVDYWPDANGYDRGWVLGLPAAGERVIANPRLQGDTVAFSTLVPGSTTVCGPSGSGYFMVLSQFDGGPSVKPVFDIDDDGRFNPLTDSVAVADGTGVLPSGRGIDGGIPSAPTYQINRDTDDVFYIVPTSVGTTVTIRTPPPDDAGRVSWRELRR